MHSILDERKEQEALPNRFPRYQTTYSIIKGFQSPAFLSGTFLDCTTI